MENLCEKLTTLDAQDGKTISMVGDTYRILVGGEQTDGVYAAIDMLIPPKGGPGPHSHADIQESFYVIDGEIEVVTEAKTYTAQKGSFVNIPLGGLVHCFKNKTNETAHLLCMVLPAGMEKMFVELGKPVTIGTFLPSPDLTPEAMEQMKIIAEKYGQKLYPPDYLEDKSLIGKVIVTE